MIESLQMQRLRGFVLYLTAALRVIPRHSRGWEMTVRYNGSDIKRPLNLASVANGGRTGGGFKIAPGAELDDGQLDLVLGHTPNAAVMFWLLPKVMRGTHLSHTQYVTAARTPSLVMEAPDGVPVHLDGELFRSDASSSGNQRLAQTSDRNRCASQVKHLDPNTHLADPRFAICHSTATIMHLPITGTLLNTVTVIVGGILGVLLGNRLPEKTRQTVLSGLGLITIVLGITMAVQTQNILIPLFSVLIGGIIGEGLRIEDALERLGRWFEVRLGGRLGADKGLRAAPQSLRASSQRAWSFAWGR